MRKQSFYFPFFLIACVFMIYLYGCSKGDSVAETGITTSTPTAPATPCSGTAGPLFTAVKNLVTSRCVFCHNATTTNGGMNFAVECNIVTNKTRIKVRAVDEGSMPPSGALSAADKATISAWINAGGKYTD